MWATVEGLPDWQRLLFVYGPALAGSWVAIWALWQAWRRERERGRELSARLTDSAMEQAKASAEMTRVLGAATEYLRDLAEQGQRAVTKGHRP